MLWPNHLTDFDDSKTQQFRILAAAGPQPLTKFNKPNRSNLNAVGKPFDRFLQFENPAAWNFCGYYVLNFGNRRCGLHPPDITAHCSCHIAAADRCCLQSLTNQTAVIWMLWASYLTDFCNSKTQQLGIFWLFRLKIWQLPTKFDRPNRSYLDTVGKPFDQFLLFKNPVAWNFCGYYILNFGSSWTAAVDSSRRTATTYLSRRTAAMDCSR